MSLDTPASPRGEVPGPGALSPPSGRPHGERRSGTDRRARATRPTLLGGRRAAGRRAGERENIYVDRHRSRDLALCLLVLILNVLDAAFTLHYLMHGGREANPIAQFFLDQGTGWFTFSKAGMVALCVLFLLIHRTFRFVKQALIGLAAFYGLLLGYHLYLHFRLFGWLTA